MPPTETRDDVLARLARSDVVSLRSASNQVTYKAEVAAAYDRYEKVCKPTGQTVETFLKMIQLLKESRLTINIKAPTWFYDENKYSSYTNYFERGYSGASNDMQKRNAAEMEFGRYQGGTPPPGVKNAQAAQQRIADYGVYSAPDFRGRLRPRYAAVDFGKFREGGCAKYGKSFLILKEHMKHNATYVHKDSFEVNMDLAERKAEYGGRVNTLDNVTATYFELAKILLYCDQKMLGKIYKYASGAIAPGTEPNLFLGLSYIEAHLHADIEFKRDVDELVVNRGELNIGVIPHPRANARWPNKKTAWDASDGKRVDQYATKFARANNIKITFV